MLAEVPPMLPTIGLNLVKWWSLSNSCVSSTGKKLGKALKNLELINGNLFYFILQNIISTRIMQVKKHLTSLLSAVYDNIQQHRRHVIFSITFPQDYET